MNGKIFWKIVKKEVERQKTSFEWLYRKTSIPKGTFSSWKSRNIMPRTDAAFKIAQALGVSIEYLLTGADKAGSVSNPRIHEIMENIVLLNNNDIEAVRALVKTMSAHYTGQ
jgi:transcriptional regulator with XRE-family HTH domain